MDQSNQDVHLSQEPKARLPPGITGPEMAADTPYPEPHPGDRQQSNSQDFDGLQVLETGKEVVPQSELPEALPQHQHPQYAEYKPWPQYSPPQQPPPPLGPDAYSYPVPITPGSTTLSPYSGDVASNYQYHGGHNPFGPHDGKMTGDGRICGLRKRVFWIILAIVIFVVVTAIAIGLGVGLGTRSSSSAARCVVSYPLFFCSPPRAPQISSRSLTTRLACLWRLGYESAKEGCAQTSRGTGPGSIRIRGHVETNGGLAERLVDGTHVDRCLRTWGCFRAHNTIDPS